MAHVTCFVLLTGIPLLSGEDRVLTTEASKNDDQRSAYTTAYQDMRQNPYTNDNVGFPLPGGALYVKSTIRIPTHTAITTHLLASNARLKVSALNAIPKAEELVRRYKFPVS